MNEPRTIILSKVNMRDVISRYCNRPIRRGRCACPIHNGNDYNLEIFKNEDGTESYYCWVCHSAGDSIKFVSELFQVPYSEAMKMIDKEFGCGAYNELSFAEKRRYARISRQIKEREEKEKAEAEFIRTMLDFCIKATLYAEETIRLLRQELDSATDEKEIDRLNYLIGKAAYYCGRFDGETQYYEEELMKIGNRS